MTASSSSRRARGSLGGSTGGSVTDYTTPYVDAHDSGVGGSRGGPQRAAAADVLAGLTSRVDEKLGERLSRTKEAGAADYERAQRAFFGVSTSADADADDRMAFIGTWSTTVEREVRFHIARLQRSPGFKHFHIRLDSTDRCCLRLRQRLRVMTVLTWVWPLLRALTGLALMLRICCYLRHRCGRHSPDLKQSRRPIAQSSSL